MLPLFEIVGVTSINMTYSFGFKFFECEKEDNVTRALEMCWNMLKGPKNMPHVIVLDLDTTLMNSL